MATKKSTATGAAKSAPKTKAAAKPRTRAKAKKSAKAKAPAYLKKDVTQFVVGTNDYRQLVQDHNELFKTAWNPWRVRPQVFFTLWEGLRKHYGVK